MLYLKIVIKQAIWLLVILLAACAPTQAVGTSTTPSAVAINTPEPTAAPVNFNDPFSYCASIGTVDTPAPPYTGPKMPESVVKGLMKATNASADAPLEAFSNNSVWRCMAGKVYACTVGANLPCTSKANTSQDPTQAEMDFCSANPDSDFIPAAVTGHDTIYSWRCKNSQPEIDKQIFTVDEQGYIQEIWYPINPN